MQFMMPLGRWVKISELCRMFGMNLSNKKGESLCFLPCLVRCSIQIQHPLKPMCRQLSFVLLHQTVWRATRWIAKDAATLQQMALHFFMYHSARFTGYSTDIYSLLISYLPSFIERMFILDLFLF